MATTRRINSVRKKGYLFKLPVSGGVIKVWAKRWGVLHTTTHEGVVRLEYYDNEEAEVRGDNKRVILLRNCTGCVETSEFRSRPHAFQFSTQSGRHIFAVESDVDLQSWIDCINDAIKEDRQRNKKNVKKNMMAESVMREPSDHAPHVGTLMGVYNIAINQTDLSRALNLEGTYSLDVTPRGMSIISTTTETEIMKWHYKHIKYYAKSSKNIVTLEMGKRSPTGEGKFTFQTTVAKELFSMIHRNIKKIKIAQDKKLKQETDKEVERIREAQRRKDESRMRHTLRPKSMSYEIEATDGRQLQRQSTMDPFTSASTIGTVADEDLIQLEGLANDFVDDEYDNFGVNFPNLPGRNRLSMGATLDGQLVLSSVQELTETVYQDPATAQQTMNTQKRQDPQIYDNPPEQAFEDSFTSGPNTESVDPFLNVTDPFSSSARGSFYNADEDIFQSFDQVSSPRKTSTPSNNPPAVSQLQQHTLQTTGHNFQQAIYSNVDQPPYRQSQNPTRNPSTTQQPLYSNMAEAYKDHPQQPLYSNVAEALKGLKDIQLDTNLKGDRPPVPKPRTMQRATKQQLDEMWGDITGDLKLP